MSSFLLLLLAVAQAEAACPEIEQSLSTAESSILEGRLDQAEQALLQVEQAFSCGEPASDQQLARFWITEGAMLFLDGDLKGSADSFSAARRVAPDFWNEDFGPQLAEEYQRAASRGGAPGTIEVTPVPQQYRAFVDGTPRATPVQADPGLHLLQVGPSEGPMEFGRFIFLPSGQTVRVTTNVVEPTAQKEPTVDPSVPVAPVKPIEPITPRLPAEPPPEPEKAKIPVMLVVGGAAAVASAVSFGLYAGENKKYPEAKNVERLDAIKKRQSSYGAAGIGFAAVSATGVALHFVF